MVERAISLVELLITKCAKMTAGRILANILTPDEEKGKCEEARFGRVKS